MGYTACFTGHRPNGFAFGYKEYHTDCVQLKHQLYKMVRGIILKKSVTHFISGVALGVDIWGAEIVLELQQDFPGITLEAAVPCRTQADRWRSSAKARYNRVLEQCNRVTVLQEQYTNDCMMKRNRYMVEAADFVVAVWNGKPSGTANTIRYAKSIGKTVYCIDALTFKMREIKEL